MANTTHANAVNTTTTLVTTAETVCATLSAFNTDNPSGEGVLVTIDVNISPGAGTTSLVLKLRQGTGVGGVQVGNPITVASGVGAFGFSFLDNSALALNDPNGLQYVATVTQTGATGNGSVTAATITASSATAVEG
jgi:hypothetical protein